MCSYQQIKRVSFSVMLEICFFIFVSITARKIVCYVQWQVFDLYLLKVLYFSSSLYQDLCLHSVSRNNHWQKMVLTSHSCSLLQSHLSREFCAAAVFCTHSIIYSDKLCMSLVMKNIRSASLIYSHEKA